jgi:hypothetical protein
MTRFIFLRNSICYTIHELKIHLAKSPATRADDTAARRGAVSGTAN